MIVCLTWTFALLAGCAGVSEQVSSELADSTFAVFMSGFEVANLPHRVDVGATFEKQHDGLALIDSSHVKRFLLSEGEAVERDRYFYGKRLWETDGLVAVTYYLQEGRSPYSPVGFLATFTLAGQPLAAAEVSRDVLTQSAISYATAWVVPWSGQMSVIARELNVIDNLGEERHEWSRTVLYRVDTSGEIVKVAAEEGPG